MSDKRRTPRLSPFVVPCRVVDGESTRPGFITELSLLGARITCDECPPPGASVVVEAKLGRRAVRSRLPAQVVWTGAGARGPAFGVSFHALPEPERTTLAESVQAFQQLAQRLS